MDDASDAGSESGGFTAVTSKGKPALDQVPDSARVDSQELTQQQINEKANTERAEQIILAARRRLEPQVKSDLCNLLAKSKHTAEPKTTVVTEEVKAATKPAELNAETKAVETKPADAK